VSYLIGQHKLGHACHWSRSEGLQLTRVLVRTGEQGHFTIGQHWLGHTWLLLAKTKWAMLPLVESGGLTTNYWSGQVDFSKLLLVKPGWVIPDCYWPRQSGPCLPLVEIRGLTTNYWLGQIDKLLLVKTGWVMPYCYWPRQCGPCLPLVEIGGLSTNYWSWL
jgi:hypothetical protein